MENLTGKTASYFCNPTCLSTLHRLWRHANGALLMNTLLFLFARHYCLYYSFKTGFVFLFTHRKTTFRRQKHSWLLKVETIHPLIPTEWRFEFFCFYTHRVTFTALLTFHCHLTFPIFIYLFIYFLWSLDCCTKISLLFLPIADDSVVGASSESRSDSLECEQIEIKF